VSPFMSKKQVETRRTKRQARREEIQRKQQQLHAARKRRFLWIGGIGAIVAVVIVAIIMNNILNNNKSVLASDNPAYPVINDIACQTTEQLSYHVHAHLSIYMNGQPVSLPAKIGIASDNSCIYWLHTHSTDGIIHIESPNTHTYSLGTFLRMWEDHFSQLGYPAELDSTAGWTVYVNGKPYTGDFHNIQLKAHELITLAYNSPDAKPDTTYSWGDL